MQIDYKKGSYAKILTNISTTTSVHSSLYAFIVSTQSDYCRFGCATCRILNWMFFFVVTYNHGHSERPDTKTQTEIKEHTYWQMLSAGSENHAPLKEEEEHDCSWSSMAANGHWCWLDTSTVQHELQQPFDIGESVRIRLHIATRPIEFNTILAIVDLHCSFAVVLA